MTATGPIRADLDPADLEVLVSRVIEAARVTRQDPPRRPRLLAGAVAGLAVVAAVSIAGVLLAGRQPGPTTGQPGVVGAPSASVPASATAPASQPPTASPSPSSETWGFGRLSFTTPPGWSMVMAHRWTMPVGPIAFLANVPVADPCSTELLAGEACWRPVDALPPDGVLVTFSGMATVTPRDLVGKITTGPAEAACASLGGEERMGAPFGGFSVSACLRGPNLAAGEAAFREIVASLLASTASR